MKFYFKYHVILTFIDISENEKFACFYKKDYGKPQQTFSNLTH